MTGPRFKFSEVEAELKRLEALVPSVGALSDAEVNDAAHVSDMMPSHMTLGHGRNERERSADLGRRLYAVCRLMTDELKRRRDVRSEQ